MDLAARVLDAAAPDAASPVAVRNAGVDPVFSPVEPSTLVASTAETSP